MTASVVQRLIVKDWQLHRVHLAISIGGGVIGLVLIQFGGMTGLLGLIGFFTSMIVLSSMLPNTNINNERKGQHLAFLMSLPISATDYTAAKILASVGLFLAPWLALVLGALSIILGRSDIPNGLIPLTLILSALPLLGFCLLTGVALVSESEVFTIAVMIGCNVLYSLSWTLLISNPGVRAGMGSKVAEWNPTVLTILGWEFTAMAVILALTFYLQSRKRDFV